MFPRLVQPEWLDELPPEDPRAAGSRRDLERLNAWMGHAAIVSRQLLRLGRREAPPSFVELGAGDGRFLLSVARRLSRAGFGARALLVDKQPVALHDVAAAFSTLGWHIEGLEADVLKLPGDAWQAGAAAVANLFLHHFTNDALARLFERLAPQLRALIAVEPRRSRFALLASRLVALIGCNRVTRHDAPISVRAGFAGLELSSLWPRDSRWTLEERRAGCFSHLFVARLLDEPA